MSDAKKNAQELAKDRTGYAEKRTEWAEDRTLLANERTFAGWMRTGLAAVGIGLGFQALFGKIDPTWLPKLVASSFMAIAILIFLAAYFRARKIYNRLDSHSVEKLPAMNLTLVTVIMCVGALFVLGAFWTFKWT